MQRLNLHDPGMPDLQFVLMVIALSTSGLSTLNLPEATRRLVFDRCWVLLNDGPPPANNKDRVLDLRFGDHVTLEAMVEVIRSTLTDHGVAELTWDHPPSEPTQQTTPEAQELVDRLQKLYPPPSEARPDEPHEPPGSSDT